LSTKVPSEASSFSIICFKRALRRGELIWIRFGSSPFLVVVMEVGLENLSYKLLPSNRLTGSSNETSIVGYCASPVRVVVISP